MDTLQALRKPLLRSPEAGDLVPKNNLSLIDYDSAAMAIRSRDLCAEIHVQQELLRICRYALFGGQHARRPAY